MRCLCCNKEIQNPSEYEAEVSWHKKCIKSFFGTTEIPMIDLSEKRLEELANSAVNKGLTVPGVQKKLSLHLENSDRAAKLTVVNYPTGYILKPESKDYSCLPESEFLSMKIAEMAGVKTVPNALIRIDDQYAYITKRIDRNGEKKYAMEDFCQLLGRATTDKYKSSYENCGKVIKRYSHNVGLDLSEFYYRLLICFSTGNSDMHLKNFSLIEDKPAGRVFALSPAYDLLPVNIIMPEDKEQMALTLNGKKRNITRKDFYKLAENLQISEKVASGLMKKIQKNEEDYYKLIDDSYIPDDMKDEFKKIIRKRVGIFD